MAGRMPHDAAKLNIEIVQPDTSMAPEDSNSELVPRSPPLHWTSDLGDLDIVNLMFSSLSLSLLDRFLRF